MRARGRHNAELSGASLDWSDDEAAAYREALAMVERSCKLVFPEKTATVCMFTGASLTGHALVLTQVRRWQDDVPVEEQQHELLVWYAMVDFSRGLSGTGPLSRKKATLSPRPALIWTIC
ncbi:unnamed protein product [Phytophthora fragariaefolia]|uniref:Unnamed protein product n=1 Tax=Phytophthora fragariaefolia TaxID=1490495 RepID=A0A9W7D402_9STRA|nr:unnamed protein product [Phytophthora fragariaefolia]